ncbi:hypothetical protein EC990741_3336 [Escherichia coli 97.0259]|nr:hypothetical protein EC990741_3336 [Escherichia coli 97.0259]
MLSNMKIFITEQQKAELERLHDSSRDGQLKPFFWLPKAGVLP